MCPRKGDTPTPSSTNEVSLPAVLGCQSGIDKSTTIKGESFHFICARILSVFRHLYFSSHKPSSNLSPWEYCSTTKCQLGMGKSKLTEKHADLQRRQGIILLERKKNPTAVTSLHRSPDFILPVSVHPDQQPSGEVLMVLVALCSGDFKDLDLSQAQMMHQLCHCNL